MHRVIYNFISLFFIIAIVTTATHGSYLLKAPPLMKDTKTDLKQALSMTFSGHDQSNKSAYFYSFKYREGKTYLVIQFEGQLPQDLTVGERAKLTLSKLNNKSLWSFVYPTPSSSLYKELIQVKTVEEDMGLVAQPLLIDGGKPHILSIDVLWEKIKDKHVAFYTGAGISAGAVPTMDTLLKGLHISEGKESFYTSLKKALDDPEASVRFMNDFTEKCLNARPTQAHVALKEICLEKNWGLITENIDQLHQKTGVQPLNHSFPDWLAKNVAEEAYKKIDIVITVGLQSDESGFLKRYKELNPKGIIVALNLAQPTYLSNSDFLILGDCQKLLPALYHDSIKS